MINSPSVRYTNDLSFFSEKNDKDKNKGLFTSFIFEETKIEKYIKIIEYELKKHNFSMDQRCFIENLIKILDLISKLIFLNNI